MNSGVFSLSARRWAVVGMMLSLAALTGCQQSCGMRGLLCMDWLNRDCQNCDSCRPRLFAKHMCGPDSCPSCGERGCTRAICQQGRSACTACSGKHPRLFQNLGAGCSDPRVAQGRHGKHGKHGQQGGYQLGDPRSPWSEDGPGSFHPVPTRPVYGPYQVPADAVPNSDEVPSDPGLESLPLRDLPRNLDTPSDPRNLIPVPENVQPDLDDFPDDTNSGSMLKKPPVQQSAWRAQK